MPTAWISLLLLALVPQAPGVLPPRKEFSLNGVWEARHDPGERGALEGFPGGGPAEGWVRLAVPSVLQEHRAFAAASGVFWLRCPLVVENDPPRDRRQRLRFERALEQCQVWVNGTEVGGHEGGDTPFSLDVTGLLVKGSNQIVVRLSDRLAGALGPGWPPLAGLPGNVVLEECAPWTVENASIAYLPAEGPGVVDVEAECASTDAAEGRLALRVEVGGVEPGPAAARGELAFALAAGGRARPRVRLSIPDPVRWDPSNPRRYAATLFLLRGETVVDAQRVLFGLREVGVAGERFLLNGRPFAIKAAVDSGYHTATFLRPGGLLDSQRKVKSLKDAGFNAIVTEGRLAPRALVEKASELGLLVIARPALRGADPLFAPLPLPGPVVLAPIPNLAAPGAISLGILAEQVRRDRSEPSVVWWGIPDAPRALVREAARLDGDALASRDAVFAGRNALLAPGARSFAWYLRPEVRMPVPPRFDDVRRILDLGDRGEFAFVTIATDPAPFDAGRVVAGLGGDRWRLDLQPLLPSVGRLPSSFERDGLRAFFDAPDMILDEARVLRGEAQRRAIEAARANLHLAGYAVRGVADSPWEPGTGLLDFFGRATPSWELARRANTPRRMTGIPMRRAMEAQPKGAAAESIKVLFGQMVDDGDPIEVWQFEAQRPDELSAYSPPMVHRPFPFLREATVGFGADAGVYMVHPLWKGKDLQGEMVELERVPLVGIHVPRRFFDAVKPPIARPAPYFPVVGPVGDLWENEERFLEVVDALAAAKAGGTAMLFSALRPDSPLVVLGLVPEVGLLSCEGAYHAQIEAPVFTGAALRGIFGDPLNEMRPAHTMASFPKENRWSVALDRDGAYLGTNFGRIPYGRGSLVLTTLALGEQELYDGAARRILSDVYELVEAGGAPAGGVPERAPDREDWRARYREAKRGLGR